MIFSNLFSNSILVDSLELPQERTKMLLLYPSILISSYFDDLVHYDHHIQFSPTNEQVDRLSVRPRLYQSVTSTVASNTGTRSLIV